MESERTEIAQSGSSLGRECCTRFALKIEGKHREEEGATITLMVSNRSKLDVNSDKTEKNRQILT